MALLVFTNGAANPVAEPLADQAQALALQAAMFEAYKPENLIQKVRQHETDTLALRDRFNADYKRFRLEKFNGLNEDERGYLHYTSNAPRTYADKLINWTSNAELIVRVDNTNVREELRRINDGKEKFGVGALGLGDNRLKRLFQPVLRDQMGFHAAIRGLVMGRALLVNTASGETEVDITPFDPLNTFWGMGAHGLAWMCHRTRKTRVAILEEYGVDVGRELGTDSKEGLVVYDWYDQFFNTVVMTEFKGHLKPPTPHGSPRIPVYYSMGGYVPMLQSTDVTDSIKDWAESIYAADREVFDSSNHVLSILLDLASKMRQPGHVIKSPDGSKTFESDPNEPGAELAITTADEIERLRQVEATKDLANTIALFDGEKQRGSLAHIQFGDTPFSLSGFAMNTLRSGAEEKLNPRVRALEEAYLQIINLLADQYTTGMFAPITVKGLTRGRQGFDEVIPPQVVAIGGAYTVKLVPQLPQDDQTKIQMAQLAREVVNGKPLMDDRYILDNIMDIQDVDNMLDRLNAQMAERASPMAQIWANMQAAINQGEEELAMIYLREAQVLAFQQWAQSMGLIGPESLPPPPGGPEGGTPANPRLLPSNIGGGGEAVGIQSRPVQQAGPVVAPGTPRPGARNEATRLSDLGLAGPRG